MAGGSKYLPWVVALAAYAIFWAWYMPWGGPLTSQEIDAFLEGRANEDVAFGREIRRFIEADDGRPFVMVNMIDYSPDGEALSDRYMDYMWPALFRRACHPVFVGEIIGPAMDLWGIEGASNWSNAALMRYRSLRDLLQIVGNPEFSDSHEFKSLAMVKTIAVPATGTLNPGDLRILVGLFLLVLALGVSWMMQTIQTPRRS